MASRSGRSPDSFPVSAIRSIRAAAAAATGFSAAREASSSSAHRSAARPSSTSGSPSPTPLPRKALEHRAGEHRVLLEPQQVPEVGVRRTGEAELPVDQAGDPGGPGIHQQVLRVEVTVDEAEPVPRAVQQILRLGENVREISAQDTQTGGVLLEVCLAERLDRQVAARGTGRRSGTASRSAGPATPPAERRPSAARPDRPSPERPAGSHRAAAPSTGTAGPPAIPRASGRGSAAPAADRARVAAVPRRRPLAPGPSRTTSGRRPRRRRSPRRSAPGNHRSAEQRLLLVLPPT